MKTPRPLTALVAAIIAHVAYLQAPDPAAVGVKVAWYAAAIIGTAMVAWLLLHRLQKRKDQRPLLAAEIAARVCETLIFVGAGYSTIVPPGVIKLGGVLPLGWSCAVMSLLLEYVGVLGMTRGLDCRHSWQYGNGFMRLFLIAFGVFHQALCNLWNPVQGDDASILSIYLTMLLAYSIFDCVRSSIVLIRAVRAQREG
jgi:hypothetical protein